MAKKAAAPAAPCEPCQYRISIFKNRDKKWQWRISHINSSVLATSEAYSSYKECCDTAKNLGKALGCKPVKI